MLIAQELRHLITRLTSKEWLGYALAAVVFGYGVPARFGIDFLETYFLLAYACLPGVFVAPMVADSVLEWRPTSETERVSPSSLYRAQVLAAALFAWLWGMLVLVVAMMVANSATPIGKLVLPPAVVMANIVAFGTGLTLVASAAVGWLALNSKTAAEAKGNARRAFLLVLLAIVMYSRMGPAGARRAMDQRLMESRISMTLMPAFAVCFGLGLLALRGGAKRKAEDAEGPLFKL